MTLGKIRTLCRSRGLSITDLEKAVGMSNGAICKWEGKSPGIENVKRVADYFDVTVDELLSDDAAET